MRPDEVIEEGDTVSVHWDNVQHVFNAVVLAAPSEFGQPWVLRENNGTIHYVMVYSRMTRQRKSESIPQRQQI